METTFLYLLILISTLTTRTCLALDRNDFYDYSGSQELNEQVFSTVTPIKYPHWSDPDNTAIDIVNSGVVRFSGLDGDNTLDILTFATKVPLSGQIYVESYATRSDIMKDKIVNDLADIDVDDFTVGHAIVATWVDVQFAPNVLPSTFQLALVSNANTTYAIIFIEQIHHEEQMDFYPEFDLRYAYEEGTKDTRSNFLFQNTDINSGTPDAATAAEKNSNSGLEGRWILDLTQDPRIGNGTGTNPTALPPSVAGEQVSNYTGLSMKGKMKFTTLSLNGALLTDSQGVDEISAILSRKDYDSRYEELDEAVIDWVKDLYEDISSGEVKVKILAYRTGSLTFDYSVEIKDHTKVCRTTSTEECLDEIKSEIMNEIDEGEVDEDGLSGTVDTKTVEIADFDECDEADGLYCDINAYCLNYPEQLNYGCVCKDGFIGDGFVGNCERNRENESSSSSLVIIIAVVVCILAIVGIAAFVYIVKRREKAKELEEAFIIKGSSQQGELDSPRREKKKSKFNRSTYHTTRNQAVPDDNFDLYHKT